MNNTLGKYTLAPETPALTWQDYTFYQANNEYQTQSRYIRGLIDSLYAQKNITEETAAVFVAALRESDRWVKEMEIALRKEMQEKGKGDEDN